MSPPRAEPTGGTRTFRAGVRLIAASNRDLAEAIAAGILGLKRTILEARMKKHGIRRQALGSNPVGETPFQVEIPRQPRSIPPASIITPST